MTFVACTILVCSFCSVVSLVVVDASSSCLSPRGFCLVLLALVLVDVVTVVGRLAGNSTTALAAPLIVLITL